MQDPIQNNIFNTVNPAAERSTILVMWITAIIMIIEIVAGWHFNSMALLVDGWNMGSHTIATSLSVFAYKAARYYASDSSFAFGTWKIEVLSGFTGAILLLIIALFMIANSVERFFVPQHIYYQEAIMIAVLGLLINLLCAKILSRAHDHNSKHDLNLKSVYIHILTDAATSILAIIALIGGLLYRWDWLDPCMGIVGAVLIAFWSKNLLCSTAKILLDREMDHPVVAKIRQTLESSHTSAATITDLHFWRVGKDSYSCSLILVTASKDLTANSVRTQLAQYKEIVHSTIEINHTF
jgi:cation diffusion facilitator family transporter